MSIKFKYMKENLFGKYNIEISNPYNIIWREENNGKIDYKSN